MKKKIIILILVIAIVTILNVVSAAFLYFDIQAMEAPDATLRVELVKMNSTEAVIRTTIDIRNPNNFDIITKDIGLVTKASNGENIAEATLKGGVIGHHKNETFTKTFTINFKGNNPETLETKLTGTAGIKSGFIQKTLTFSVKLITTMDSIITNILLPNINIHIDFGELSQKSVNVTTVLEAYNPNPFDMNIRDVTINMTTEKGQDIGYFNLTGGVLAAESSLNLSGKGTITIETLNAKTILASMDAIVDETIAGYTKSLPVHIEATVGVPDLKTLLPSKLPTEASLRSDFRASLRGMVSVITIEIRNPNKVELEAKDITITTYRIDSNTKRLLGECSIPDTIIKADNTTSIESELVIPYLKLFVPPPGGKFIPDWIEVDVRANVTIKGLINYIWGGIVAYQDFHPFRIDKVYTSPATKD